MMNSDMQEVVLERSAKTERKDGEPINQKITPSAQRKIIRIQIVRTISIFLSISIGILTLACLIIIFINTIYHQRNIETEIYFSTGIITALIGLLGICIGIIGGSSIN